VDGGDDGPPADRQLPQGRQQVHRRRGIQAAAGSSAKLESCSDTFTKWNRNRELLQLRQPINNSECVCDGSQLVEHIHSMVQWPPPVGAHLVGSSSSSSDGLMSSSWPTEVRLRSPPEMPLRKNPAHNGVLAAVQAQGADDRVHALLLGRTGHVPWQPQLRRVPELRRSKTFGYHEAVKQACANSAAVHDIVGTRKSSTMLSSAQCTGLPITADRG